eukprot:7860545-Pyramimonas_sp.AAC.1
MADRICRHDHGCVSPALNEQRACHPRSALEHTYVQRALVCDVHAPRAWTSWRLFMRVPQPFQSDVVELEWLRYRYCIE